jgi:hypothetical protein
LTKELETAKAEAEEKQTKIGELEHQLEDSNQEKSAVERKGNALVICFLRERASGGIRNSG